MLNTIFLYFCLSSVFAQNTPLDGSNPKGSAKAKYVTIIDEDNDKIFILDLATRHALNETIKKRNLNIQLEKDVASNFYKESMPIENSQKKKPVFDTYKIEHGDDWLSISQKLFNDQNHWSQLQFWNEDLLKNIELPEGAELKYIKP